MVPCSDVLVSILARGGNTAAGVGYHHRVCPGEPFPVAALALTSGATWWLNLTINVLLAVLYIDNAQTHGAKRWHCVGAPVTALLFQYIIWRATLKTLRTDGIDWRGTHYSLQELKANKV